MAHASLKSIRAKLATLQRKIEPDPPPARRASRAFTEPRVAPSELSAARGQADKAAREAALRKARGPELRAFRSLIDEIDALEATPAGRRAIARPGTAFALADDLERVLVSFSVRRATWRLEQDFSYTSRGPIADRPRTITVRTGFEFDLASIPRVLWSALAPNELSLAAPLIHDYLYVLNRPPQGRTPAGSIVPPHAFTRAQADDLFYEMMIAAGVSKVRADAAWTAVRLFGGFFWDS